MDDTIYYVMSNNDIKNVHYLIRINYLIWYNIIIIIIIIIFGKEEISLRTKKLHLGQLQSNQKQPCCV